MDHIDPVVGTADGWIDWNTYIDRLFCPVEKLQALCELCHKRKCDKERIERNEKKENDSKRT